MNLINSAKVIEWVFDQGVIDFCLCAGARNSPLISIMDENKSLLEKVGGNLYHFFEERSASFFALGRSQISKRPVAIITTSGTATTELISATVEAFYTQTPLILITADRPPNYRGTGAPQSIEQIGIFSHYAYPTIDLYQNFDLLETLNWDKLKPLHLNVCLSEPLLNGDIPILNFNNFCIEVPTELENQLQTKKSIISSINSCFPSTHLFFSNSKRPLFIISGLSHDEREFVLSKLKKIKGAFWIESLSGLRGHPEFEARRIKSGERFLQFLIEKEIFDSIIRIGSIPTTRLWRDLEMKYLIPVLSLSNGIWSGLARESLTLPLIYLQDVLDKYQSSDLSLSEDFYSKDIFVSKLIHHKVEQFPCSQWNFIRQLSQIIQTNPLYLGNSLPIREWDFIANPFNSIAINGNRGANGIDGQLSTFFGWKPKNVNHSWAILGDLTTLYDLSAPWIISQLKNQNWTLVIMNNSGGQIFKPMFEREAFINRHNINFENWAKMWGLTYSCLNYFQIDRFYSLFKPQIPQILELRPSEEQSNLLRQEIESIWKTNLL